MAENAPAVVSITKQRVAEAELPKCILAGRDPDLLLAGFVPTGTESGEMKSRVESRESRVEPAASHE
jgi:hypothetical protein